MKTLITFMALLIAVAANAQKSLKTDSVYLTGKINNLDASKPNANTIIVIINDLASNKQLTYSTTAKSDGTYRLAFLKTGTQDVMFKHDQQLVFIIVSPGDHTQIDFDANNFERSLVFKGDNAKTNQDYRAYLNAMYNDPVLAYGGNNYLRYKALNASEKDNEPEAHKKFLTALYAKETAFLNNYIKANKLSPAFVNWAKADLKYDYLNNLMRYVWLHAVYNKKQIGDFVPPDNYFDFINEADLYNLSATVSSNYGGYASECFRHFMSKKLGKSYYVKDEFILLLKQRAGIYRDVMLSQSMYHLIDGGAIDLVKTNMNMFKANEGQRGFTASVEKAYDRIYNYTLPVNATINNLPKTAGDSLFNKIISKYPGKVVYVDFWATWCLPCRAEMPFSKNLHDQLAGKDVVFVYLGVKSDEKLWKSLIAELGIQGEHFFLNEGDFAAMSQKFQFSGVPHYLLVNKQGRIISDNARRPSDEQLKPEIEKLLASK
ncbi:thioredoxin-like domain-containing protein [Mucilaginibacter sp. UR6-11]|uniref:thioredoxin-like domain-containing protein n=1 Tax=Mucilaginibacter sp. UR6-11 TaxID=1435644 RepID=UPI001E3396F8|nr:thioredoxin-like domain-containing protein [Mucilaginibacter sp. UR6-11]MCC8424039.1 redoxin family protein [Mucilaginibacter sp. UR6-11]